MKIGVLALQGAVAEHIHLLGRVGADAVKVRYIEELENLDGLIIPGGESTTIGKLSVIYDLMEPIRRFARHKAVWGTCAGMVLMAKRIGQDQPLLGLMDIEVERNAFGRQVDSFEFGLKVDAFPNGDCRPFPAVFIRAPKVKTVWGTAEVISRLPDGTPVAARQGRLLVTAFHPELSEDDRFHRSFAEMARH